VLSELKVSVSAFVAALPHVPTIEVAPLAALLPPPPHAVKPKIAASINPIILIFIFSLSLIHY
jgi:hypothetical protein